MNRFSLWYAFLKSIVAFAVRIFNRFTTKKSHTFPKNVPFIIAPTHQNALLDALVAIIASGEQTYSIARADVFNKPLLAKFFDTVKMLPIYRQRDGVNTVVKNQPIFDRCVDLLSRNQVLLLFPEGDMALHHSIRPLRKGICRIVFQAESQHNFELGTEIVPTGITYDNYYKFQTKVYSYYGQPIKVKDYQSLYEENPNKAIVRLRDDLFAGMKAVSLHINNPNVYELTNNLLDFYIPTYAEKSGSNNKPDDEHERFLLKQQLVEAVDKAYQKDEERLSQLGQKVQRYVAEVDKMNLRPHVFERERHSLFGLFFKKILLLLTAPLALYGWLNHAVIFHLPVRIVEQKIKNPHFQPTVRFGIGLALGVIFYLLQTLTIGLLTWSWETAMVYLLTLPGAGFVAYQWYIGFKKFWARWRYNTLTWRKDETLQTTQSLRQHVFKELEAVL